MTISAQLPNSQKFVILKPVLQHLVFAQQRLQDRHVPFQLAALSYLRICCSSMRTYQRLGLYPIPFLDSKISYLALLKKLLDHHPHWWMFCYVSEYGYLISGDSIINRLLHPLNQFVAQILESQVA